MTLVEAAIVLALIGLVSGLVIERLKGTISHWRLQSAAELVAGELTRLRVRALGGLGPLSLRVAETGNAFWSVEGDRPTRWYRLPPGVRMRSLTRKEITFYSRGNVAPAGSYLVENESGQIRIIVSPMGRVRWEWQ